MWSGCYPPRFIKNIILLDSFNGAWWFLHSYVFLMIIPPKVLMWIPKKLNAYVGIIISALLSVGSYFIEKTGILSNVSNLPFIPSYLLTELWNIIRILPAFLIGAFLCKLLLINRVSNIFEKKIQKRWQKPILLFLFVFVFIIDNVIHKSVLTIFFAVFVFAIFNIWRKSPIAEKVFLFLGTHSTNIWLCHMFFYARVFPRLIFIVKYPVFYFTFLLVLCVLTSYVINFLHQCINKGVSVARNKLKSFSN